MTTQARIEGTADDINGCPRVPVTIVACACKHFGVLADVRDCDVNTENCLQASTISLVHPPPILVLNFYANRVGERVDYNVITTILNTAVYTAVRCIIVIL